MAQRFQLRTISDKIPTALKDILVDLLVKEANRGYYFQSCITCAHWDKQQEICNKFQQRPPATVIVNACENYHDEDIPF